MILSNQTESLTASPLPLKRRQKSRNGDEEHQRTDSPVKPTRT
jgi:hypothetical protein